MCYHLSRPIGPKFNREATVKNNFKMTDLLRADGPRSLQPWNPAGRTTHPKRISNIPLWTQDKNRILEILQTAFPGFQTNPTRLKKAARWFQVIDLYYAQRCTRSKCADELGVSVGIIDSLLIRINKVVNGLSANGRKRRRMGRPKKAEPVENTAS